MQGPWFDARYHTQGGGEAGGGRARRNREEETKREEGEEVQEEEEEEEEEQQIQTQPLAPHRASTTEASPRFCMEIHI